MERIVKQSYPRYRRATSPLATAGGNAAVRSTAVNAADRQT